MFCFRKLFNASETCPRVTVKNFLANNFGFYLNKTKETIPLTDVVPPTEELMKDLELPKYSAVAQIKIKTEKEWEPLPINHTLLIMIAKINKTYIVEIGNEITDPSDIPEKVYTKAQYIVSHPTGLVLKDTTRLNPVGTVAPIIMKLLREDAIRLVKFSELEQKYC